MAERHSPILASDQAITGAERVGKSTLVEPMLKLKTDMRADTDVRKSSALMAKRS